MPVLYTAEYPSSDINHAVISVVICVKQPLGMLAVISFWHTQLLGTLTMI